MVKGVVQLDAEREEWLALLNQDPRNLTEKGSARLSELESKFKAESRSEKTAERMAPDPSAREKKA
jgi:hypothetical protein